jgi:hypothetical protein
MHLPQPLQIDESMDGLSVINIALNGQTSIHLPHARHSELLITANRLAGIVVVISGTI